MNESWKKIEEGAIISHDLKKAPKTGDWSYMKPLVDKKLCIGCGSCFNYCPEAAIDFDVSRKADIDYHFCKGCGVCATVCPKKAIRMKRTSIGG